nr:GGDEF domain-containing protein [uncultured Anaeromusa sp.]
MVAADFSKRNVGYFASLCVLLAGIAYLDYLTIHEIDLSIFYLLPVGLASWQLGLAWGRNIAFLAVAAWGMADWLDDYVYKLPWGVYWASVNHAIFFLAVAEVTGRLRLAYQMIERSAFYDALTGLYNRRAFFTMAEKEIQRSRRYGHSLTVCYIDVDHFKQVNDTRGHEAGDQLLCEIGAVLAELVRQSDIVARLGGDEFALLLPETDRAAQSVLERLRERLQQRMDAAGWPVTFSVGAVTCQQSPPSIDDLVQYADALMYQVKHQGKNQLRYEMWQEENK